MADYQYQFNGLTIGDGTPYKVRRVEGLTGYGMALVDITLPRHHGETPGASYMTGREVGLEVWVEGEGIESLNERLDELLAAFKPMSAELSQFTWKHPGQVERMIEARVADIADSGVEAETELGFERRVDIRLKAPDPVVYSAALDTVEVEPFASAEGLSYPVSYPKSYGSGGSGGGATVTNSGRWPSWPRLEIVGGSGTLTNPVLENVTSGLEIALTADGGASVAPGQTLVIETHPRLRSVRFLTGASRYGTVAVGSVFWQLEPGENTIRFRASGDTTGALLRVKARSAWLRG